MLRNMLCPYVARYDSGTQQSWQAAKSGVAGCQHPLIDIRSDGVLPTLEQTNRTDKLSTY